MEDCFAPHVSRRQSGLPPGKAVNITMGDHGMQGFFTGRVINVNFDQKPPTVDVLLDNGSFIPGVIVSSRASGPDRADEELPMERSIVVIGFAWGTKTTPFVLCVLDRATRLLPPASKRVISRRVLPCGTHAIMHVNGAMELQTADGTYVVIGDMDAPTEDHTGQATESKSGDPLFDPQNDPGHKPSPFRMTIKMADGSSLTLKDGAIAVHAAAGMTIEAAAAIDVTAGGDLNIHGSGSVAIKSDVALSVDAPVLRCNGGTRPVARVGDPVDVGSFGPFGGVLNLTGGNHSVLA